MASSNIPGRAFGDLPPSQYPGERLGLPEQGSGSVARPGRRIIALLIDWGLTLAIVAAVAGLVPPLAAIRDAPMTAPAVFAILQIIFIPTIGGGPGHRLCGIRVVPIAGGYIGLWRPVVRSVLLCLVIPALVWDSDQRGFHDKIAATVLIRS